jgi:hypothetical protein
MNEETTASPTEVPSINSSLVVFRALQSSLIFVMSPSIGISEDKTRIRHRSLSLPRVARYRGRHRTRNGHRFLRVVILPTINRIASKRHYPSLARSLPCHSSKPDLDLFRRRRLRTISKHSTKAAIETQERRGITMTSLIIPR